MAVFSERNSSTVAYGRVEWLTELTIAELAARTGISVRTIRFYSGMNLIPPPEVRGRLGLYDDRHIARLELVRDLQGLGFTLAAIEGYLARIPMDRSPEDLALTRALLTPWLLEEPEQLSRSELDERAGREIDDDTVGHLVSLGVVHRDGDQLHLTSTDSLRYTLAAFDSGFDFESQRRSRAIIDRHTARLAEDLFELFHDSVLREFREQGRPAERRDELLTLLEQMKPMTLHGVVTQLEAAVTRLIRDSVNAPDPATASDQLR